MSVNKITYSDKQAINTNPTLQAINKVQDTDMNEIKSVVNDNADLMGDLTTLATTEKSSIVGAINEIVNTPEPVNMLVIPWNKTSISCSANSLTSSSVSVPERDGYTCIANVFRSTPNIPVWLGNDGSIKLYNFGSSTVSISVYGNFIYKKN